MGLPYPKRESNRGSLVPAKDFGLRGLRSDFRRRRRLTRRAVAVSVERASSSTARPRQRFGRFHPRPAALALNWQPTNSLYSHPMAHRGFVLFIAGPVRGKQRSTIATKAPPDSFQITAWPTRRADLTLRAHERACRTPGGMRPSLLPLVLFSFREMNMMSPGLIPHLAN
jgi:hypothetical protein